MQEIRSLAAEVFTRVHGSPPDCVSFAPGCVEILGNHTDINGGYVLSLALEPGVAVAAGRVPGFARTIDVWSEAFGESARFSLDPVVPDRGSWANPVRGTVRELDRVGVPLKGTRLAVVSGIPPGAGLGSSSALELATAEALFELQGGRPSDPMELVQLCRRAEESFLGLPPGLIDPFSSLLGKKDHALFLDCATQRWQQIPLTRDDLCLVLVDTQERDPALGTRREGLRESFRAAARCFDKLVPEGVRFLRDVTVLHLERYREELDPETFSRAEHVVQENTRVVRGLAAVKSGNYEELGRLQGASHASSRDLLGNSTPPLDFLVAHADGTAGCIGTKLTGPGYGGFAVSIVEREHVEPFVAEISAAFEERFSTKPTVMVSGVGNGAACEPA